MTQRRCLKFYSSWFPAVFSISASWTSWRLTFLFRCSTRISSAMPFALCSIASLASLASSQETSEQWTLKGSESKIKWLFNNEDRSWLRAAENDCVPATLQYNNNNDIIIRIYFNSNIWEQLRLISFGINGFFSQFKLFEIHYSQYISGL